MQSVDVMDNQSDLPQVIFEEMPEDYRDFYARRMVVKIQNKAYVPS